MRWCQGLADKRRSISLHALSPLDVLDRPPFHPDQRTVSLIKVFVDLSSLGGYIPPAFRSFLIPSPQTRHSAVIVIHSTWICSFLCSVSCFRLLAFLLQLACLFAFCPLVQRQRGIESHGWCSTSLRHHDSIREFREQLKESSSPRIQRRLMFLSDSIACSSLRLRVVPSWWLRRHGNTSHTPHRTAAMSTYTPAVMFRSLASCNYEEGIVKTPSTRWIGQVGRKRNDEC